MRKISIVQRRLETGLDLTQAELRALQREARFQSDQAEASETTVTAVEDPLSFLPPTRPVEELPAKTWRQAADSEQHTDSAGIEALQQEDSGEQDEAASSIIPEEEESAAGEREGGLPGDSDGESVADSSTSVSEEALSTSGEELREAVNEIFKEDGFAFESETAPVVPEQEEDQVSPEEAESNDQEWQNEREVLFSGQEPRERFSSETTHITKGESPGTTELPTQRPAGREETLVLFLLQVPGGGLAASFSASQDTESPFAGQLKLRCKSEDSSALPGEASEFDVNLPPEGLVRLSTGRVGNNGHEWALISLDEEARSYATFDLQAGRNLKATAAVFSKSPSRKTSVPLRTTLVEDKGLVLANPTDGPVVIRFTLFDDQGNQVSSGTPRDLDPLPAGKQVAIFAKSVFRDFPGITSFKGKMVAEVIGEGLMWSAGLGQNDGVLSFMPVNEVEQSGYPQG